MSGNARAGLPRVTRLLASSSVAALLIGAGAPAAWAQCAINDVGISTGTVSNSAAINCINIQSSTVTGNVVNTSTGTITAGAPLTNTGITVNNSTIGGTIVNAGKITTTSGNGIIVSGSSAAVSGGISNSGTISGTGNNAIVVVGVTNFSGGISNSGTIAWSGNGNGILLDEVSTFSGSISNSGMVSASHIGFQLINLSVFAGGITNSGTISATNASGIAVSNVAQFGSGGISNSGTISAGASGISVSGVSTFAGGISNSGTISAGDSGISVDGVSILTGGISNSGTITSTARAGIAISGVAQFGSASAGGGISNSGTISGVGDGISLSNVTSFYGGIVNAAGGTISGFRAIEIFNGSLFAGGINNRGTIIGVGSTALRVSGISTFQGGITNSGTISGPTGIFIFSGSIFTGGISNSGTISATVSSGVVVESVVQFGSTSAGGGIVNSGTISAAEMGIDVFGVTTFLGGITNSGTVSAGGAGLYVYNGASFTGGISNGGTISAATGISVGLVSTFSGGISNAGTITAGNVGITVFGTTGHATQFGSTSAGAAISNTGIITAATGIRIGADVSFAGVAIVNTGTITGTTSAIDASAATNPVIIDQNAGLLSGNVLLSPNADVLNINGGTIVGNIVGLGLSDTVNFQTGGTYTDTDTFTGINAVNINSGTTLALNSTGNSATNVNVGGTLAGTGSVAVTGAVSIAGTLSPGSPTVPLGTFTIDGALAFESGSYYGIHIAPGNGNNSATDVTGSAGLNGNGTVVVTPQLGHYGSTHDTIMTAAPVDGMFAGLVFAGPYAYTGSATLAYDTDHVYLNLTPGYVDFAAAPGAGQNQQNVVAGINNYILSGGTLPPGFVNLGNLSGPAYLNALTQLDGEDATGAQTSAFQLMTQFLDLLLDPTTGGGTGGGGGASGFADEEQQNLPPDVALAYARALHKPAPQRQNFDQRWSAWGSGFGGSGTYDGNAAVGSTNVTASDYGYAGGMDYHLTPDTVYGFALGGGGTNWNLATSLGSGRSDSFEAGVYAKTHWGAAYMSGALGFANHWFTTNRIAVGDQLTATFQGQSYAARGEAGYRYAVPVPGYIIGVTPYAALQVQDFHTPGYSETDLTGGGFGLTYSAMNATDTRSELGARFDNLTVWDGMPLVLRGRLAWAHDWVSNPALGAVFEALPGSNFTVNGAAVPQNSALTTAAAELHLTANWTAIAKFDGEFASTAQTYAGTGTLRYTW
jgi:uncharacterized protein with beta-barrel porin domain